MPSFPDRLSRPLGRIRRAVLARRRLLAATLVGVAVAAGVHAATAPPPPTVGVLTAARDLPVGTVVDPDDLVVTEFAPDAVPAGLSPDAVGRTLAGPLRQGEPLTDVRLVGPELTIGRPDLTAVPVRLPDAGMAELLDVGDVIDLIASDPQGSGATVVATDVVVLALPSASAAASAAGQAGGLVVVGADPADVADLSDAGVRLFLTYAFTR